jgi:D-hexose-6-phosphate mutarotase
MTEADDQVTATWTLTDGQATNDRFPQPYAATFTATFGAELELVLTVENTGDEDFSYEEALHTYLAVGDIREVTVTGLDGASYLDKAPGAGPDPVVQQGDITFAGETDGPMPVGSGHGRRPRRRTDDHRHHHRAATGWNPDRQGRGHTRLRRRRAAG